MKIACVSDLHGHLPTIPEGVEVVIIGGDIGPFGHNVFQLGWLNSRFRAWLEELKGRNVQVVGVAGNHDTLFEDTPQLVPELPWTYLCDESCILNTPEGLHVWGSPWSNTWGEWAFQGDEDLLKTRYDLIPKGVKVIVSHGPPYGYGDACPPKYNADNEHLWPDWTHEGSRSLLDAIDRVKPKLVVYGHIHQGYGTYKHGETTLVNAAIWNHMKDTHREPIVIDLD